MIAESPQATASKRSRHKILSPRRTLPDSLGISMSGAGKILTSLHHLSLSSISPPLRATEIAIFMVWDDRWALRSVQFDHPGWRQIRQLLLRLSP